MRRSLALALILIAPPLAAANLVVTNAGDAGTASPCDGSVACSLRQAILLSNSNGTDDRIVFAIPGAGPHVITPTTALPAITAGTLNIEGSTQAGSVANSATNGTSNAQLRIVINGASTPLGSSGITVNTDGTVALRGLSIHGFRVSGITGGHGVNVISGNFSLSGCWIGVQPNGAGVGNQGDGVRLAGLGSKTIGNSNLANRNVIARNRSGVFALGAPVTVTQNLIGLLPNGTAGGNVTGVLLSGDGHVLRNNSISGNSGFGIDLADGSDLNQVLGNRIGSDPSGTQDRGNALGGVRISGGESGSLGNQIGTPAEPNLIAFNLGPGIALPSGGLNVADANTLAFNRFFDNEVFIPEPHRAPDGAGALAIDLGNAGVTSNDSGDVDGGPNGLQNFPVLASANRDTVTGAISVSGTLNSRAGSYRLVFYGSRNPDPSGHGEGEFLAAQALDLTAPGGSALQAFNHIISFSDVDPATLLGISATATRLEAGVLRATSEMSATRPINAVGPNVFVVTKTADTNDGACNADCSLREAMLAANATANIGGLADVIHFNVPGSGQLQFEPATPLPTLTQATIINGYSQPGSAQNTAPDDTHNAILPIILNLSSGPMEVGAAAVGSALRGVQLGGINADRLLQVNASGFTLSGNWIGVLGGTSVPAFVAINAPDVTVGGPLLADRNVFARGRISLQMTGGNRVRNNLFGVFPDGSVAPSPMIAHVFGLGPVTAPIEVFDNLFRADKSIEGGIPPVHAHDNRFVGTAALLDFGSRHRFERNRVDCTVSNNAFSLSNATHESLFADNLLIGCSRAIDLGVGGNDNDPQDADVGPNGLQNYPVLLSAARQGDSVRVVGSLNSVPNSQFRLRFCAIAAVLNGDRGPCDLGEVGEPLTLTTDGDGDAVFVVSLPISLALGATRVSATASRLVAPNVEETSEFSDNVPIGINTPPTYIPNTPITRAAGSLGPLPEVIGTAVDQESPGSALIVNQVPGGTANGITLDHFSISGTLLSAVVNVACSASSGTTNVQVSDGELTNTAGFLVNVSANTLPTLSYGSVMLAPGSNRAITPLTGPSDNGFATLSVQSTGTYTGNVSVAASGVVSLIGAAPVGTHTLTVRATDNCGALVDVPLVVTVSNMIFANGFD